jgi:hypothetical protein
VILFYGCWTSKEGRSEIGHFFNTPWGSSSVRHRQRNGVLNDRAEDLVPWGYKVDGTLAPRTTDCSQAQNGCAGFHQAISWVGCPG